MDATVSEIHAYPLRPEDFAEPLFRTRESRKEVLEHLARSEWLGRASELTAPVAGHRRALRPEGRPEGRTLASWREVDLWWEPGGGIDVVWRLFESACGKQYVTAGPVAGSVREAL